MRVRLADKDRDRSTITEGIARFAGKNVPPHLVPRSTAEIDALAQDLLKLDQIEIYIAESNGRAVGGLAVLLAPYIWNPHHLCAEEICFWSDCERPSTAPLALIRFAERRAKERNASMMMMHALAGVGDRFGDVLQRKGYAPLQTSYLRMI